jgi:hypothetical protein
MPQLSREDMKTMTPEEIDTAHEEGRFDLLLGHAPEYVELVDARPASSTALT